jgi:hypothetical protein
MDENGAIHYVKVSRAHQYKDGTHYDNGDCSACGEELLGNQIIWRVDYCRDTPEEPDGGARTALRTAFHQYTDVFREYGRYKAHFWCARAAWGLWDPSAQTFCLQPSLPLLARRLGVDAILAGIEAELPAFVGFDQFETTWAWDQDDPKIRDRQRRPPKTPPAWLEPALVRWAASEQPAVMPVQETQLAWLWSSKYHKRSDKYLLEPTDTDEWVRAFARPDIRAAWLEAKAA